MSRSDRQPLRSLPRSRLLALPFVALCAVVYVGSAAHFALVQHGTCLEHGEVTHLEVSRAGAQPRLLEASFTDERLTRTSRGAAISHGADAHCTHAFLRRESLLPAAWCLLAPEASARSGRIPALEQVLPEPVARLRLAPKSSPPLS